jgi:NAD(P)-dependent dehydrogenase (short-subunit alcohol dehydrogenase family)
MKTQKVWLITGASRGFGLEIARAALAAGDQVIATVRSQPTQLATALHNHPDLYVVQMDVTQEDQVQAAVEQGIARFERVDILVNNAGYGIVTAIEEATDAEVRKQYDTNVFGFLNVTRALLPHYASRSLDELSTSRLCLATMQYRAGDYTGLLSLQLKDFQKG